jgi:hypothetical protein
MPANSPERVFLNFSAEKLKQLASRVETCLGQLTEEQVWLRGGENENAMGNLVLHLCGNVRQWILSGIGNQPDERRRNAEFAARGGASRTELSQRLNATVTEAISVIETVEPRRLTEPLTIQGYDVCMLDAIYHAVEHFAMHAGQIIFITKMFTGTDLGFYRHLSASAGHTEKAP